MWRINEFGGLMKTGLLQGRGCVYGVVPLQADLVEYNA